MVEDSGTGSLPEGRERMAIMADDLPPEDPGAGSADGNELLPGPGGSISWCWDFDFAALLDAVTGPAPWLRADQPDGLDGASEAAGFGGGENVDPQAGCGVGAAAGKLADPAGDQGADPETDPE